MLTLRRYGIDDGLEIRVPMEDTELLLVRIERVCAQVRGATNRIDRASGGRGSNTSRERVLRRQPGRARPIGNHDDKAPEEYARILRCRRARSLQQRRKGA